jgi:predicted nucleic acid-binding protein
LIVVDASAVVKFLAPRQPDCAFDRRLGHAESLHAPHLVDVEVANGLRRSVAAGLIGSERALDALLDLEAMPITLYPHGELLRRAWELRENLTVYDAVYVTLAELLGVPLITCDRRLAQAPGVHATIELFEP